MRLPEVIGLVPAAGKATRIAPLPCSKELLPVGSWSVDEGQNVRPKAVCQYLLERMRLGGVGKAYFILRAGKWDIPTYFGDGSVLGMSLAYLVMRLPFGVPYTLDQAYPFVQNHVVALGFPDIIFEPKDAFVHLLDQLSTTDADIVLGLFPTDQPQKADVVEFDPGGQIRSIIIKQEQTGLRYAWIIAVWTPVFTRFMHEYLSSDQVGKNVSADRELFVGDIVQAAIGSGLRVKGLSFPEGTYLDIGTPDDLAKAREKYK